MRGDVVNCKHCGTEFTQKKWNHLFCKDGCSDAYRRGWSAHSQAFCKHCGDAVVMRDEHTGVGGRKRKYCSDTCRLDHVRGKPIRPPEERAAAREAYLKAEPEYLSRRRKRLDLMPAISDQEIGWNDIFADIRSARENPKERKFYGYQAGDRAVAEGAG